MPTIRRAVVAAALGFAPLCGAGVIDLGAARDNTLYEYDLPTSNGAGQYCFTGLTAEPTRRRTLIAFDVQAAFPEGATLAGVALTMNMSKTIVGASEVSLHRVRSEWGEGDS